MKEALVLAHGAFHGPWCWDPTVERLEARGIRCVAVDLNRGGLHADRDALQEAVDALREEGFRVHAIGHSLGCPSVALIDPTTIATATLLAGPVEGPSMPDAADCIFPNFLAKLLPQDDGRAFMSQKDARDAFYHRCTDAQAEWALDRLRPTYIYGGEVTEAPIWQTIPVTYIACNDDHAVRPDYQHAAAQQFPFSVAIDTDHSPMLSRVDELAEIIETAMGRAN